LGLKCENLILEFLEILFTANTLPSEKRLIQLNKADIKLKILKTYIRISFEVKAINLKRYLLLESPLQEIGSMLGGWIKSLKIENPDI